MIAHTRGTGLRMILVVSNAAGNSLAASARELVESRGLGILCTNSKRSPGYPFASVTPYAIDAQGRPVLLMSRLAVHTKNLAGDSRASLLVFEESTELDPLNSARLNLLGDVVLIPEPEIADARARYLVRHPEAEQWAEFGDFAFYRIDVVDIYYVGGFGVMGWASLADYREARGV